MSKNEFMEELKILLGELPKEEREEAIRYYESYFEEAGTSQEQIVLEELGSAGRIAAQILRDYRMENGGGVYTEKGYQAEEQEKQSPIRYSSDDKDKEQRTEEAQSSGVYVTKKGLSGGALVVVILAAIVTFPIWISVLGVAFGLLMGFFGASVGITVGFGFGGIGGLISGVIFFALGLVNVFTTPAAGAAMMAVGLLLFGAGCLMIALAVGVIQLAIWIINGIIKICNRMFHGKKGANV